MPQTSLADIIFTDLSSSPVTVGADGATNFNLTLPGTVESGVPSGFQFGFAARHKVSGATYYRTVAVGKMAGTLSAASVQGKSFFALHRGSQAPWKSSYAHFSAAPVGTANHRISTINTIHAPVSYAREYLSFYFKDSTQGNLQLYGWVEVSLNNSSSTDPNVIIYGYAYDNSGAPITTGAVPEPSSAAILALGALSLGAKGIRSWRRRQAAALET